MSLKKIGVVGAGMMGAEISLCFANAGYDVVMSDATMDLVLSGKNRQETILDKSIKKGKVEASAKEAILGRITATDHLGAMADADLVIEVVVENLDIKKGIFETLDGVCKKECVIASNTSSIPITRLATTVSRERTERFLGMHFFLPPLS